MFRVLFILFIINPAFASEDKSETNNESQIALKIVQDKCQHCHGLEGEASNVLYPRLAGQHYKYIIKQLHDFRSGKRKGTMNDMAKDLTDPEIIALASYFSAKPTLNHRIRNKEFAQVGWYIFHRGNEYSGVPACSSCHGENGEGSDSLPRIAGQHKRYVADQLTEFNNRERTNDNAIMHSVASKLTEMEIHAVANYVSGLK
ncbi:MAG: cytochrome c4 [Gammaproteobacteria bacterium]|nr:cytochrome c4 [Gammaproteobacteria bacterium]